MSTQSSRTDEEILEWIEEIKDRDFFGAEVGDLVMALTFEAARPWLSEAGIEGGAAGWAESSSTPEAEIREYLPFAISKAQGHRGLSAGRSVSHLQAWVWLMGDDAYGSVDWNDYAQYGAPILKRVAELVEFEWPADEELERMAQGESCEPGCLDGCG